MRTVLVVGPSVPDALKQLPGTRIIHKPCIRLVPLTAPAFRPIEEYEGIIVTSKHAAAFLKKVLPQTQLPHFFSIGPATSRTLRQLFPACQLTQAAQPTQEGLGSLILQGERRSYIWFRSTESRPYLTSALRLAGILVSEYALYAPQPLIEAYSFENVDEIFFGSPSSVKAFFSLRPDRACLPSMLTAIGPVTEKSLRAYMC